VRAFDPVLWPILSICPSEPAPLCRGLRAGTFASAVAPITSMESINLTEFPTRTTATLCWSDGSADSISVLGGSSSPDQRYPTQQRCHMDFQHALNGPETLQKPVGLQALERHYTVAQLSKLRFFERKHDLTPAYQGAGSHQDRSPADEGEEKLHLFENPRADRPTRPSAAAEYLLIGDLPGTPTLTAENFGHYVRRRKPRTQFV